MIGDRCGHCPATADQVCPYQLWHSGCRVERATTDEARAWHLASVRRQLAHVGPVGSPTAQEMLAIETCTVRTSSCNCLGKPATCRKDGSPVELVCLAAGPNATPCEGVHVPREAN